MKKDLRIFLLHILDSINLIEEYTKNKSKEDFEDSLSLQDMTIRRLEIIGEAIKNLPQEFKDNYTQVPWKKISGLRDKLIHEYFGIDIDLVWTIIVRDLPELKQNIEGILEELS
ncbi:MAG: hypothetical protein APG12_01740 [Candidatus Methanofastidiosum methylothiophilum]|uniref:DUF86 domain-containing protein n=1 Tax=Candidatus Methanofastidiosum methylothiophilum TaxID=1705564 RepID=A0A150IVE3_9EURY|nr:MAG: hypothetical protein APG10_01557 [Candidatus Methanofastidiosum methylthiophilus]KYC46866.1 MAG: hypothetical protein APG11_01624 [Candidatus Methanofastidiosum methylthiophilus]KYC48967.1 MAG: hypothetical protein APG12_01740 [Candidatus Methanofastidiosum methylthiophilus]